MGHRRTSSHRPDGGWARSNGGRKVAEVDNLSVAERDGALHAVFQLTHVAGPVVLHQGLHRGTGYVQFRPGRVALEEPVHEHGSVAAAFAQGRNI